MADLTTAFWGMTINNYDDTDLAMVQNGYPDHMRELVYTLEEGEEGTKHIQAYFKLQRQQRLSFVKKLFPRGHFKALMSASYIENTKRYAQKLDGTARSPAVHTFNDPFHTVEGLMKKVILRLIDQYGDDDRDLLRLSTLVENEMVVEDYTVAKIFVSATYLRMWKHFAHQMYECLFNKRMERIEAEAESAVEVPVHTHTHTHTEKIISHEEGIPNASRKVHSGKEDEEYSEEGEDDQGDFNSESSESEASDQSDDHECSEYTSESED